ncbi:hypothetical protein [Fodinibius salsisoli]|uniref:Uncharacterized protein n=1 Tax=Fodinibius salsisoli TaxID=2820877 RepID=A0ABT3PSE6_9BACT|nr:hypothetical protein [Fodinibius salsisoli]MCW9708790.1 hypothetical protein [Fodinibius salsisoli]
MRKVARAHHIDALDLGPLVQRLQVQVFAGGAGIVRVDVKIRNVSHRRRKRFGIQRLIPEDQKWRYQIQLVDQLVVNI